jgi:hypothetical protein
VAQLQGVLIATCKEWEISSQEQQNERIESLEQEVQTLLCGRGELKSKVEEQSEDLAFAQAEVKSAKRACVMLAGVHAARGFILATLSCFRPPFFPFVFLRREIR